MAGRRKGRGGGGWLLALLLLLLATSVLVLVQLGRGRGPAGQPPREEFGDRLRELAARRGASGRDLVADQSIRKLDGVFVRTWRVTLPDRESVDGFLADLEAESAAWQGTVVRGPARPPVAARARLELGVEAFEVELVVRQREEVVRLEPTPIPSPTARPSPRPGARGRLAILLDDGGQDLSLAGAAAALPKAVGVAVLPFLPHSAEVAGEVHRAGHEVWLHLPMEPEAGSGEDPGPGAVRVEMSEDEIRSTVHAALNSVPHVVGVNNHMGSRATRDYRTMTWVMQELKAREMAFLDSRTTAQTVAEEAARAQGVKAGRRHLFLDNDRSRQAIRLQLAEAVYRCRSEGPVLAIGHMSEVTIEVLEEELPGLAERGADLVPPSRLTR